MGLSERKKKQRIGDDPRNTKWAKNESNPGFKILSSMGWSPARKSLGAAADSLEPGRSTWKRLPGSVLPVIKSTTSGLGSNPNQAISNSYLFGAPRFVPSSQSIVSVETAVESNHSIENDPDKSAKISIVSNGGTRGGGFDDLLSRLNRNNNQTCNNSKEESTSTDQNLPNDDSFVFISVDQSAPSLNNHHSHQKTRSIIIDKNKKINRPRKRVRILEFCHDPTSDLDSNILCEPKLKKIKKNHKVSIQHKEEEKEEEEDIQEEDNNEDHNITESDSTLKKLNKKNKKKDLIISNLSTNKTKIEHLQQPILDEHQTKAKTTETKIITTSGNKTISRPFKISNPINARLAARTKYINSKKLASSGSIAMAEILGIPPIPT